MSDVAVERDRPVDPLLVVIVATALLLRLFQLGADSFWIDEMRSVFRADGLPFLRSVRETFGPGDPPLGFAVEALARRLPVLSLEFAARLPMALASTAEVVFVWMLVRRLFGRRSDAALAAGLVALTPFAIRYGQEARYYALASALHLAGWILVVDAVRGKSRALWFWCVVSILAVYTTLLAWLGVLSQAGAGWLAGRRGSESSGSRWVLALAAPIVAFAPWVVYEAAYWAADGPADPGVANGSYDVRFDAALWLDIGRWLLGNGSALVALPFAAFAVVSPAVCRRSDRRMVLLVWCYLIGTVGMVVLLARLGGTYFAMRRVLFLLPVMAALVAVGAAGIVRAVAARSRPVARVVGPVGVAVAAAALLVASTAYYQSEKSDYRAAAAVHRAVRPDVVVLGPVLVGSTDWRPPIRRYLEESGVDQPVQYVGDVHAVRAEGVALWIAGAMPGDPRFRRQQSNDLEELQSLASDDSLDSFVIPVVVFTSHYESREDFADQVAQVAQMPVVVGR